MDPKSIVIHLYVLEHWTSPDFVDTLHSDFYLLELDWTKHPQGLMAPPLVVEHFDAIKEIGTGLI